MTWTLVGTLDLLADQWVYTEPITGHYFRLVHTYSRLPDNYFRGKLGQIQVLPTNSREIFDIRNLTAKEEAEIFQLKPFPEFVNRRIGIRGPTGKIPPIPWSWRVQIEVSDFLEEEGGGGDGTSTAVGQEPWKLKSADYIASPGDRLLLDTTSASFKVNLPSNPALGDEVTLLALQASINQLAVDFDSAELQGISTQLRYINTDYNHVKLVYSDSKGWIVDPQGVLEEPFNPLNMSGVILGVESNALSAGFLSSWSDLSTNQNHLVQSDSSLQPEVYGNALNGYPVVRFTGGNQYLNFKTSTSSIRTVYWILRLRENLAGFLLGHASSYDFHQSSPGYFDSTYVASAIKNGTFRRNGQPINTISTDRINQWTTLTLRTTGPVSASSLSADRNNAYNASSLKADVAAVYLYSSVHSDDQILKVESYLRGKYLHY